VQEKRAGEEIEKLEETRQHKLGRKRVQRILSLDPRMREGRELSLKRQGRALAHGTELNLEINFSRTEAGGSQQVSLQYDKFQAIVRARVKTGRTSRRNFRAIPQAVEWHAADRAQQKAWAASEDGENRVRLRTKD